jgi:hypothetical protein
LIYFDLFVDASLYWSPSRTALLMASTAPVLAPGQSPPLTVISPTNQGGVILIITALGMVFALVSILIRLYIRLQIRHAYERDDTAIAVAMVGVSGGKILELKLIVTRYFRYYNQVLFLWRFQKAMAEL